MNAQRTLAWTLSAKLGFNITAVKSALLSLAAQQFAIAYESGGRTVASGTIGGESVSFDVPPGFNPAGLSELCRATYREITAMTDAELETYCLREDTPTQPDFSYLST